MKHVLALACLLLVSSCSSYRQWLPSYTDPDFAHVSFNTVAVFADTADLSWRKSFERTLAEELRDEGVAGHEGSLFLPPTRAWTDEQMRDALKARGIDALLRMCVVKTESYEELIPERRVTTKEKKPVVERVRYRENGKWVEKDSVTGTREVITTNTEPAQAVWHTRKQFQLLLVDMISGRTAWVGDYWTNVDGGFLNAMCQAIARQLVQDGIVRTKQ